jgi:Flp pilus assembly protein TadG
MVVTSAAEDAAGQNGSRMHGRAGRPAGARLRWRGGDGELGGLSLMIVVLFVALLALAGIVVDGGAKLTADENATALAQEAARAGATTVDVSRAYATGSFIVDPAQAVTAAQQYLTGAGYRDFTVTADGDTAITVQVTITDRTKFLSLIGVRSFSTTRAATAELVTGVTGGP